MDQTTLENCALIVFIVDGLVYFFKSIWGR
jgi:hypothetical protein